MSAGIQVGMCLFGLGGTSLDDACRTASMAGIRPVSFNFRMLSDFAGGGWTGCWPSRPKPAGYFMRNYLDMD